VGPSLLACDFANLEQEVRSVEQAGAKILHLDIMDGHFVPNISFGIPIVEAVRRVTDLPLDVHLMIVEPERHLAAFADAGADRLIVHQETCPHLHRVLQGIRELKIEAGLAINPGTPLSVLEEVLHLADLIQVMTVNPGWGGQPFLHSQLDKIRRLRRTLDERGLDVPIAVDGGISPITVPLVVNAGATVLIAGSSIYNDQASLAENVAALRASVHPPTSHQKR
ncbi:MAG: ribulose-phosphate 3-epimerase, partial [Anaerolineae bacterium]|nr:ribulose-phosphate 3-epimerase [Anaerolineae bacterium]